jgi:SAM-dependent methyltransferase
MVRSSPLVHGGWGSSGGDGLSASSSSALERHNRRQRRYFERSPKPGMRPAESPYHRRHVDELLRFGGMAPGQHILEVGAGMGQYTFLLAERGLKMEALDLSSLLLERLRDADAGRFGIPTHTGDVAQPPEGLEGRFDAVIGLFTLHHVHDLTAVFRGVAGLLRPGGRTVFLEPNPLNPLYYIQVAVTPGMSWRGERGILRMRFREMATAMRAAGLRRPELRRFGLLPPFLANLPRAHRLETVLERVPAWRAALAFQLFRAERP